MRDVVNAIESSRPGRKCNGGPNGPWCDKPATVVCTDETGLQWYACDDEAHRDGAKTMPIAEWWALLDRARV